MNRLVRSTQALLTLAALSLAGCPSEPAAGHASTTATAPAATTATAPASSAAAPGDPVGTQVGTTRTFPVVAGTSCAGHEGSVAPDKAKLEKDPATSLWTTHDTWGCGCPTGPVFTLVYEPKTSPLKVHLCKDPNADHCEALCGAKVAWDLGKPMREAGATTVELTR